MLGYSPEELINLQAEHTAREISQQPATWLKTIAQVQEAKTQIKAFIAQVIEKEDFDIIFTGAGTSEFVGNVLYSCLNKDYDFKLKSYATTDIVAAPNLYVSPTKATLLISFGRSGSSPESLGAIDAVNAVNPNSYHLFITCNPQGEMAKRSKELKNCLALVLTEETCDKGFAMTSSFSNMLLCAYLCLTLDYDSTSQLQEIDRTVRELLENNYAGIKEIVADFDYQRIVYLGANTFKGIAQEAALKMLELTAGRTVTLFDTPLGFRHGPKSIIDETTLIVVFLSEDPYTKKYDIDLVKELSLQRQGNKILLVSATEQNDLAESVDYRFSFSMKAVINNSLLGLAFVVFAQIMALYKSLSMGITTDNPCPTGELNRVVKGVVIYPY